ncbi:hypothetical protein PspLS_11843 [Pyricularia sp. CBS 133598]|nr:hypothetical protein PspLS_11843 [Pyricularia sp. CBS 133598]
MQRNTEPTTATFPADEEVKLSDEESTGFLYHNEKTLYPQKRRISIAITLSACSNLVLIAMLIASYWNVPITSSYSLGWDTDLAAVKPEIELVQYHFSGGIRLEGDKFIAEQTEDDKKYVEPPSHAVDTMWYNLQAGLNLDLAASENAGMDTMKWPDSDQYFAGIEMYHSLHCLNRLRQALHPEYYHKVFNSTRDPSRKDHIGHCINHLRQAIQCHGDLTPMVWQRVGDQIILKTDTPHTCRNFDKIQAWSSQRSTNIEERLNGNNLNIVD